MLRNTVVFFLLMSAAALHAQSEVAPGITLFRGTFTPGRQPDGNTVVVSTPTGLIVIDTGRHAEHTQRILDFAAASKSPIASIINTHWHLDTSRATLSCGRRIRRLASMRAEHCTRRSRDF
jgi:glyoxylase-like metal-dependent hydrolase (beta-lactamase superfamily II)